MATRSSIAIRNPDGSIDHVYCHFDGYLSNNGKMLLECYSTEEQVRKLLSLGDMSSLDRSVRDTTYYGRDKGETGTEKRTSKDIAGWLDTNGQEFNYLFDPGISRWVVSFDSFQEVDLESAVVEELDRRG